MKKLYKNRYVMDKKTGLVYRTVTSKACVDGRRLVESSRIKDTSYGSVSKFRSRKCQIMESQLIPLSKTEGVIAWRAEQIMRGKGYRSSSAQTILAFHKMILEAKGMSRGCVEKLFSGAC